LSLTAGFGAACLLIALVLLYRYYIGKALEEAAQGNRSCREQRDDRRHRCQRRNHDQVALGSLDARE
jgi:hypothetical protein